MIMNLHGFCLPIPPIYCSPTGKLHLCPVLSILPLSYNVASIWWGHITVKVIEVDAQQFETLSNIAHKQLPATLLSRLKFSAIFLLT